MLWLLFADRDSQTPWKAALLATFACLLVQTLVASYVAAAGFLWMSHLDQPKARSLMVAGAAFLLTLLATTSFFGSAHHLLTLVLSDLGSSADYQRSRIRDLVSGTLALVFIAAMATLGAGLYLLGLRQLGFSAISAALCAAAVVAIVALVLGVAADSHGLTGRITAMLMPNLWKSRRTSQEKLITLMRPSLVFRWLVAQPLTSRALAATDDKSLQDCATLFETLRPWPRFVTKRLIAELKSSDPDRRVRAATCLASIGDDDATPIQAKHLTDPDARLRQIAYSVLCPPAGLEALQRHKSSALLGDIAAALKVPDREIREFACRVLAQLEHRPIVDDILALIPDADGAEVAHLARAAFALEPGRTMQACLEWLRSPSSDTRLRAALALDVVETKEARAAAAAQGTAGERAKPQAAAVTLAPLARVADRVEFERADQSASVSPAVEWLSKCLHSTDQAERAAVTGTLARSQHPAGLALLCKAYEAGEGQDVVRDALLSAGFGSVRTFRGLECFHKHGHWDHNGGYVCLSCKATLRRCSHVRGPRVRNEIRCGICGACIAVG